MHTRSFKTHFVQQFSASLWVKRCAGGAVADDEFLLAMIANRFERGVEGVG